MEIFIYFFLAFIAVAAVITLITKKSFLTCLGGMLMLAAVVLVIWSGVIDDGSRRGMDAWVMAIMWGIAAGSFFIGFVLCKVGASQNRKKALAGENVVVAEEPE